MATQLYTTAVPDFQLEDQHGKIFDVRKFVGKKILVIYFYPKDESTVCTKEACAFRDSYSDYIDAGAMVIGINSGTVESHKAFAQHHRLPFTLLSDPGNRVLKLFGIKNVLFLTGRETFVIDLKGNIAFRFRGFLNGNEHSQKALDFIRSAE
jgi:peroxiredoxin Q/BCP